MSKTGVKAHSKKCCISFHHHILILKKCEMLRKSGTKRTEQIKMMTITERGRSEVMKGPYLVRKCSVKAILM